MPTVRIKNTQKYLRAIGVLASGGHGFQTRDPDILIIGNRAVAELAKAGLIPKREKESNGAAHARPAPSKR